MFKLLASIVVALLVATSSAYARSPVPIVDIENVAVATGSGKTVTTEEVKKAIIAGASANQWEIAQNASGMTATLRVRGGKHTVVVAITYSADKYSLRYLESVNMNYGKNLEGQAVIHPFYNRWVQQLSDSIRSELRKL